MGFNFSFITAAYLTREILFSVYILQCNGSHFSYLIVLEFSHTNFWEDCKSYYV